MEKKEHLPMYGVGPLYVYICVALTVIGIVFDRLGWIASGKQPDFQGLFFLLGTMLIIFGAYIWVRAVIIQKVGKNIEQNCLETTGVYAWVRNPIYSGIVMALTGISFFTYNLWLLVLPVIFWAFMTVLMKATEEKWLKNLYGKEYEDYCKRVNRCIPWFPRKFP